MIPAYAGAGVTALAYTQRNSTLQQPEIGTMMTVDIRSCKTLRFAALPALILSLTAVTSQRAVAQTQAPAPANLVALRESDSDNVAGETAPAAAAPDPGISPALAKQLAAMQAEIDELKAELRGRATAENAPAPAPAAAAPAAA